LLLTSYSLYAANDTQASLANEQALAQTFKAEEVHWLEAEGGKFLSLKRQHLTARRRGMAILLSDITTPLNSPNAIEPLRHSLNKVGWGTLSIMSPSPALLNQPQEYVSALVARLNSALAWAQKGHRNTTIIMQGRQIAYLLDAMNTKTLKLPSALILLNPRPAYAQATKELQQKYPDSHGVLAIEISKTSLPLLDINHLDRSVLYDELNLRKEMAATNKHKNFRQIKLNLQDNHAQLNRTIYGWLSVLGYR